LQQDKTKSPCPLKQIRSKGNSIGKIVIPVKTGIQSFSLDPDFHRDDQFSTLEIP